MGGVKWSSSYSKLHNLQMQRIRRLNLEVLIMIHLGFTEGLGVIIMWLLEGIEMSIGGPFTRALLGLWISHRLLGGGGRLNAPHDLGSWSP